MILSSLFQKSQKTDPQKGSSWYKGHKGQLALNGIFNTDKLHHAYRVTMQRHQTQTKNCKTFHKLVSMEIITSTCDRSPSRGVSSYLTKVLIN